MNPTVLTGTIIVQLALLSYTVGVISEQRHRRVSAFALNFLRCGVVLDILATGFMIAGSSKGPFTTHGLLGFSSLAAMILETSLAWRHRSRNGDAEVSPWLHLYSRVAYTWWIVAYITGAILVMRAR